MDTNRCSSCFPARDLPFCDWLSAGCCCGAGVCRAGGLTRSREAAKGNAEVGIRCSVRRAADGSPRVQQRLRCVRFRAGLWQRAGDRVGECVPPHPRPLSPVSRGRGGIVCLSFGKRITPLAPGRGEGQGVRGIPRPCTLRRAVAASGCCTHAQAAKSNAEKLKRSVY